jgi:gliding motility-associated-like protein
VNPIPTTYENISNPQTIYVRVDNNSTICYQTTTLTIRVDLLPIFDIDDNYILCVDSPVGVVTMVSPPIIDTGLNISIYSFEWTDSSGAVVGTDSTYIPASTGTYTVVVTNMATGCQNSDSSEVELSSPPDVTAEVTSLAFAEVHVIEASATGEGVYEFSLDGGPWQESGTFMDVSLGNHVITARDINGCGESSAEVMIMDYPLYFTPNGDGYHDTWNIIGISNQVDSKIYIFDRYGKLLKQLSPTAPGWDGTFNGEALPSSDYWFIVNYREPSDDTKKEFKAHFTLKR